jgi:predicted permease
MGWFRRLRNTLPGSRVDETFDEEARFHLEQRTTELIDQGVPAEEAERLAARRLGHLTLARDQVRDADTLPWLRDFAQDLRYGWRQLRGSPGFAATAIAALAIGVGANTALFGIVDRLLLKTLPVEKPNELVLFNWLEGRKTMRFGMDGSRTTDAKSGRSTSTSFSYPTFLALGRANQALTNLFAFYPVDQFSVVFEGQAEIASGQYVSGNYYEGLGVKASIGRTIAPADDRLDAPPVTVITHDFWKRRFDLDARVIGQPIVINKTPFVIVGVTQPGFAGALEVAQSADFSLPFAAKQRLDGQDSDLERPAFLWVRVMGRLKPGVTREQAAANLTPALRQSTLDEWREAVAARGPRAPRDAARTLDDAPALRAESGAQGLMDLRRSYAQPLLVLMGSVVLVLVTACVNVANLLLSRGAARQKEIAMRLALGAGRGRLVRQLFTESMLMASLGSLAGLPLAMWGKKALLIWRPWGGEPLAMESTIDLRMLAFCIAAAVVTGLIFGIAPALRATRSDLTRITRQSAAASSMLTKSLVVAQVAISLVLLVAASLFAVTLRNLHGVDMGFNPNQLLLFRVQPQLNGYRPPEIAALYGRLIERIAAVPGVRSATLSRHGLLGFSHRSSSIRLDSAPASVDDGAEFNVVAPNFFETMEMPLLLGRTFDDRDSATAPKVAVVNQRFATKYFGGQAIGHRFWYGTDNTVPPIEIVGMTRDAKYTDLRSSIQPTVYVPFQQDVPGQANFEVRAAGDAAALLPSVREAVRGVDPNLPLFDVRSQAEQVQQSLAQETMFARLSMLLGSIALLLAAIGLYGTMSYAVVRRTTEIGVRMALGARRAAVIGMVLREAFIMATTGVAIGIPLALAASRLSRKVLDDILFGLGPNDPLAITSAAMILTLVVVLAGFLPARRASRVDPMVALRCE